MNVFFHECVCIFLESNLLPPSFSSLPLLPLSVHPPTFPPAGQTRPARSLPCISLFPAALHLPFFSSTSPSRLDTGIVYLISVCTADGATRNLSSFIPSARLGGERRTFTLIHRQINTRKWTNCDTSERLHTSTRLSALSGSDVEVKCGKEATGSRM